MTDDSNTFEIFGITLSECQTCGELMVGDAHHCERCDGLMPIEDLEVLADELDRKACYYAHSRVTDLIQEHRGERDE